MCNIIYFSGKWKLIYSRFIPSHFAHFSRWNNFWSSKIFYSKHPFTLPLRNARSKLDISDLNADFQLFGCSRQRHHHSPLSTTSSKVNLLIFSLSHYFSSKTVASRGVNKGKTLEKSMDGFTIMRLFLCKLRPKMSREKGEACPVKRGLGRMLVGNKLCLIERECVSDDEFVEIEKKTLEGTKFLSFHNTLFHEDRNLR